MVHDKLSEDAWHYRREAWNKAMRRDPCDRCGKQHPRWHHSDCFGNNLCHDCYELLRPVTQCYPGDEGYGISTEPLASGGG